MKNVRKRSMWSGLLFMLMICAFCLGISGVTAFAEETAAPAIVSSGKCSGSSGISWTLDSNGTMTISGTGYLERPELGTTISSEDIKCVVITDGITGISGKAFRSYTNLTNINIPDSVKSIACDITEGVGAFNNCSSLTSITIPAGVERIDAKVFMGCSKLENIYVDSNNQAYSSVDGVLFDKEKKTLIQYPEGKQDSDYVIPNGVEKLYDYSFWSCDHLINVTVSKSVRTIQWKAAFQDCSNLENIYVDSNSNRFTSESGVLFSKNQTELIKYPEGKKDSEYCIPDGVEEIGIFSICDNINLTQITIPNGVTEIKEGGFYGSNNLTSVVLETGLEKIGDSWFSGCSSLTNIVIPSSVTKIENSGFAGCSSLNESTLLVGTSITEIGTKAFVNCDNLTSVIVPETVTAIGEGALGAELESGSLKYKTNNFTIYGYSGTQAEKYAQEYQLHFVPMTYDKPTFIWNEKEAGYTALAVFSDITNDEIQTVPCTISSTTRDATYEADGQIVYTASAAWHGDTYTDIKTITIPKKIAEESEADDEKLDDKVDNTQKSDDTNKSYTTQQSNNTHTFDYYTLPSGGGSNSSSSNSSSGSSSHWVTHSGSWYYTSSGGTTQIGWVNDGGTWYYMSQSGAMQTGWVSDGGAWYYMSGSGAMQTGWVSDGGTWYYMSGSGAMQTGWVNDGGTWYYMSESGAMQTGWISDGGTWYYLDNSGAMQTGWLGNGDTWYYLDNSGAMQTGWLQSAGKWYYLSGSGAMQIGWYSVGGKYYYSYASGELAVNTQIGRYRVNANGEWVK